MTLEEFFQQNPRVALGFSGGVDSSYLLYAGLHCGADLRPYYIKSAFQPQFELDDAYRLTKQLGVALTVLKIDVLADGAIVKNDAQRCYYCKRAIFRLLKRRAEADGYPLLIDGTNASDDLTARPGVQALKELDIQSPLCLSGLTKERIRVLSKQAGLFTWNKPSYACLATRIPEGQPLECALLRRVEGAEDALFSLGFTDFRVRVFHDAARVQLKPEQMARFLKLREKISDKLHPYFHDVLLDSKGRQFVLISEFRGGSMDLHELLLNVKSGALALEEAEAYLKRQPFEELGCAKLDLHRKARSGFGEVVFCQGKTNEHLLRIFRALYEAEGEALGTRATPEQYALIKKALPKAQYDAVARLIKIEKPDKAHLGKIAVCTAGTADIPVAEEAAQTAEFFGSAVERIYDVGVSGIHRLFAKLDVIQQANCIVAVAGMEGALGSIIGGLVARPVIAVPTSVGYGANFHGLSSLLTMINSCANGIAVVNIDNGYGAGYIATQINRLGVGK